MFNTLQDIIFRTACWQRKATLFHAPEDLEPLKNPQYSVRLLSLCWIKGGYSIHPPIQALLPLIGIGPTPFRNSASRVAEL